VELLIASGNPAKVREFRQILGDDRFTWRSLDDFPSAPDVDETGHTFRANAVIKASAYAKATGLWALADDSGLEVDALGGNPGVYSARWAQMNSAGNSDADNNALLLRQINDVPDDRRTARFVCVLALSDPQGRIWLTARDTADGRIGRAPVGENGFGYDPLFYVDELGRTTAQLSSDQKHRISHRGKALRRMREMLDNIKPVKDGV
jgi:XTP/dITP diphosphohydrolase